MNFINSLKKSAKSLVTAFPILIGILMLVNLINLFSKDIYLSIFTGDYIKDSLIGALAGSLSFGIPIVSYVIGGELIRQGVSLLAVAAFIISWSTVGIAMLPLEASYLGKRFAIYRNILNFFFAIFIAIITVGILKIFS